MNVRSPSLAKNKKQKAYQRGKWAEYLAAAMLIFKGYRILTLRYKAIHGEIDIIARRGRTIVFIEVKARKSLTAGKESVTVKQRERISNAATQFMKQRPRLSNLTSRYDIVVIIPKSLPKHIKSAW